jgi:hypothetical protein
MSIPGMTQEILMWKLFPFSLKGEAKQWYTNVVGSMNGDWEKLKDKFCLVFFPMSRINSLPMAILDFEQNEKESIGATWARFLMLIHASPDLSLPDSMLLHLFCSSLDIKATLYLDMTPRVSFIHKTTTEQKKVLDHILEKHASPVIKPNPLLKKGMSSFEELSSAESLPLPSLDLTVEPSPEPETPKEGVIHPSKFPIEFEDYGRTSNLPWHEENTFLSKEVSPNVEPSKEWLMEVKCSSEAIQILSPSMTMSCSLRGTSIEALHNLTVRTNIMSQFLAETLLGNMLLVSTDKTLQKFVRTHFRVLWDC